MYLYTPNVAHHFKNQTNDKDWIYLLINNIIYWQTYSTTPSPTDLQKFSLRMPSWKYFSLITPLHMFSTIRSVDNILNVKFLTIFNTFGVSLPLWKAKWHEHAIYLSTWCKWHMYTHNSHQNLSKMGVITFILHQHHE